MARPDRAEPPLVPAVRLDGGAALRALAGFLAALFVWFAFSALYERSLAIAGESTLRAFERPAVTTLRASDGEIRVDRADFPDSSARPGLPAADIHFNFVLLAALFALSPHPLRARPFGRFWIAALLLWTIHVVAVVFQVESVYATSLGPWSVEHYGPVARNFWAAGFHFYQIAGRFAAPFVLWWALGRPEERPSRPPASGKRKARSS
jgi:hypothetical protein